MLEEKEETQVMMKGTFNLRNKITRIQSHTLKMMDMKEGMTKCFGSTKKILVKAKQMKTYKMNKIMNHKRSF